MLAAANRMRSAADFSVTTRRGAKASRGCVVVYVHRMVPGAGSSGDADAPALVGLVVGKVVGNSVARHRASRRIRGAIRPLIGQLPPGCRVVVRALAGADHDPALPASVQSGLEAALRKGVSR